MVWILRDQFEQRINNLKHTYNITRSGQKVTCEGYMIHIIIFNNLEVHLYETDGIFYIEYFLRHHRSFNKQDNIITYINEFDSFMNDFMSIFNKITDVFSSVIRCPNILLNEHSTFVCSKTNYIEEVTFITPNEDEPDYNPDITYEELPDGNI